MAQTIKLKRTAVQGKIPNTSNLDLGELAINTYDGRIFFEKDVDGTLSIQEILTTDSTVSGSLNLDGSISASSLYISGDTTIDGNLVLAGNITIGDSSSDTISFAGELSSDIIPATTNTYDLGSSTVTFSEIHSTNLYGAINATNGVVSGSSQLTSSFDTRYLNVSGEGNISGSFSGSFTGDGSGLTNISIADVTEIASINDTFTNQTSYTINHSFETKNVFVSVYSTNDEQIIPTISTPTTSSVQLGFDGPTSGRVVVGKAGHVVSASTQVIWDNVSNKPFFIDSQTNILSGSSASILQIPSSSYSAAIFDYSAYSGSNARAGSLTAVCNGTTIAYNEVSTGDIGDTSNLQLSVVLDSGNFSLEALTSSDGWTVKSHARGI